MVLIRGEWRIAPSGSLTQDTELLTDESGVGYVVYCMIAGTTRDCWYLVIV